MRKELMYKLNNCYTKEGMNFFEAIRAWRKERLTPENIRLQVEYDIGKSITGVEARELYHVGESMQHDFDSTISQFEISEGRSDLIPENIKEKKIKLSPAIKQSMERLGQNLYRDKKAGTYWTLKEKVGDGGEKVVYLVAINEPDNTQKVAEGE